MAIAIISDRSAASVAADAAVAGLDELVLEVDAKEVMEVVKGVKSEGYYVLESVTLRFSA